MTVVITVVAHETNGVLPVGSLLVVEIANDLVDHCLRLVLRTCRQTAYSHVTLVGSRQVSALALVKHAEEVVGNVAISLTE